MSNASQHVPIFNRFPVIQPVSSKVRILAHFCIFWPPFGTPLGNCGKCYMDDGKRIQCWSHALQHIPIYIEPFTTSEILVGNCNFFLPLTFKAPVGGDPLGGCRDFWWVSYRMARLQSGAKNPRKVKSPE